MRRCSLWWTALRCFACLAIGVALGPGLAVGSTPARAAAATVAPHVVVVGVPDLRWSDLESSRTPQLWRLAGDSAVGSLSVKAADPVSCPDDGWLTLGAGDRATAGDRHGSSCTVSALSVRTNGPGATVGGFAAAYQHNLHLADNTHLGALADALTASGRCVSAVGREAALGAADSTGLVSFYRTDATTSALDKSFLAQCPVTLIAASSSDVDGLLADLSSNAPPGSVLLVVGVSQLTAKTAHLQVAIAHGPGFSDGRLTSASTRRVPFVQLVDVAPTVLGLCGVAAPHSMIGQRWQVSGPLSAGVAASVGKLSQLDVAAQQQARAIVPFWATLVAVMIATCAFALWVARRRVKAAAPSATRSSARVAALAGKARLARWSALGCAWCALLLAASFVAGLVPWATSSHPLLFLAISTAAIAVAMAAAAIGLETVVWRRAPFGLAAAVGSITFAVIALDLLTGAHLQIFTMAGYSPLVAGRFAGIGNVAFGVFVAGAILAGAGFADAALSRQVLVRATRPGWSAPAARRVPVVLAASAGVLAVAIDGAPAWGSDVGGVLALVPGFGVLAWLLAGVRVSWRKAVAVAVGAVAIIAVFATVDYARPATHQTHLGRFVGDLLHGGAWAIVRRKALADVHLLAYSVLTLLIPLMVVVAIWLVRAPNPLLRRAFDRAPVLRPMLVALLVSVVVGAAVNDSGIVIPALAVLVVLPATVTVISASAAARPRPERLARTAVRDATPGSADC